MKFYAEEPAAVPDLFTLPALREAQRTGAILQSTALFFDTDKSLHFRRRLGIWVFSHQLFCAVCHHHCLHRDV